jgi:uncharacterized membrane protein YphA (DoxX/SURF4 family)
MYAAYIATLIPAWMPAHLFLTYLTGTAFIAAAIAIASGIQARLGAALLGLMFLLWTVLLHAPRVFAHIHNKDELTSLFVALAMSGVLLLSWERYQKQGKSRAKPTCVRDGFTGLE